MRQAILSVFALLVAAAILLGANGLQSTLLSVRAYVEDFPLWAIGLMMSAYFGGFALGCRYAPRFIRSAGHVRAFTAFASIASAVTLMHVLFVGPLFWLAMRLIAGFCFAGLHMIIESWLNEKATNENRGQVLSVYRIADFSAVTAGQFMLNIADPAGFVLFAVVSILISLSLVPVALTSASQPMPIKSARLDLPKLFRVSPLAAVGIFCVGLSGSSFWSLAPVFVQDIGYDIAAVAPVMSAMIFGGAIAQWPIGWLSDKFDRRIVIIVVASLAALSALFVSISSSLTLGLLILAGGCFGFFHMPLFGLGIAHANDFAEAEEFVSVNGGLLLLYGIGAVIGPNIGSAVMSLLGPAALFYFSCSVYLIVIIFGIYRMTQRAGVTAEQKEDYVAVPRTSPGVFEMDPRAAETPGNDAEGSSDPDKG
ncbi:MAG: MFS transporter [Aquisalinus sp.]|nr:MFS transporter [Aquisalinus sp.]